MGKSLTMLACSLVACVLLAGCSDSTPSQPQQKKNPPPGVLVIDPADHPTPDHSAKSYRIGKSTIPAGDIEALTSTLKAAREALPNDDPNVPRLIVWADAEVAASAIAPVVLSAINCGFDYVDLYGTLPAPSRWQKVTDVPPPDPIEVCVLLSKDGPSAVYDMTGIGTVIASEDELRQLLQQRGQQISFDTPILIAPRGEVKDELLLTAYSQAIRAGFKRFRRVDLSFRPTHRPRQDNPLPKPAEPAELGSLHVKPFHVKLFDITTDANNIVYVCDCTGSMATTFEQVKMELLRSISRLAPRQDFAVLRLRNANPTELDPNGLILGTLENKLKALKFIREMEPTGGTTLLPSLKRAFELLGAADKTKPGKAIYILSDGDFSGMSAGSEYAGPDGRRLGGNDAVIQFLRDHNAGKAVQVNTILLFSKDEEAIKVFKQIAAENAGQFRNPGVDD